MISLKCHKNIPAHSKNTDLKRHIACFAQLFFYSQNGEVGNNGRLYG